MLFLLFQLLFGLPLHGPLCGRDTSVAGTDTQVPWYDTRGSDVTDTRPPPCLHLPAKSSKFQFDNARRRGSRERFNRPNSWRGEPLLGHSGCRSATWCLVCTDPYSCFHMGHCVDETLVSQAQTLKCLGTTPVALTSQTLDLLRACTFQLSPVSFSLTMHAAVARVNALTGPTAGAVSHCSATVAVAQPLGVWSVRILTVAFTWATV